MINKLDQNLISIFIIGSMVDSNKTLEKYNDYDIRILVKEMNKDTFNIIKEFNKRVKDKLINEGIDAEYSFIVGPVRHITESNVNLLLHCLPMTKDNLDDLPLTHKFSYSQNYRILYGEDMLKEYKKIKYLPKDIVFCTEGIDYCIEMIEKNILYYMKWTEHENCMKLEECQCNMDKKMMFEVLRYSISKNVNNIVNMYKWDKNEVKLEDFSIDTKMRLIDKEFDSNLICISNNLIYGTYDNFVNNEHQYIDATKSILKRLRGCIINEEIL